MKKVKFMKWECDVEKAYYQDGSIALELTHPEDGLVGYCYGFSGKFKS